MNTWYRNAVPAFTIVIHSIKTSSEEDSSLLKTGVIIMDLLSILTVPKLSSHRFQKSYASALKEQGNIEFA
jgi:hypothetical protein